MVTLSPSCIAVNHFNSFRFHVHCVHWCWILWGIEYICFYGGWGKCTWVVISDHQLLFYLKLRSIDTFFSMDLFYANRHKLALSSIELTHRDVVLSQHNRFILLLDQNNNLINPDTQTVWPILYVSIESSKFMKLRKGWLSWDIANINWNVDIWTNLLIYSDHLNSEQKTYFIL